MENKEDNVVKNKKKPSPLTIFMIFFLVTAFLVVTVHGWFSYMRKAMAIYEISNPTALYISAAQQEDINYIDLSGIDVSDANHYKDFVFEISGLNIGHYKIQLAYTTNNQFTFELYTAYVTDSENSVPNDAQSVVTYTMHNSSAQKYYYYIPSGGTPIAGTFKNKLSNEYAIIDASNKYYKLTYGEDESDTNPYSLVNANAMPLYWQTSNSETGSSGEFTKRYMLRVKWSESRVNDKETDIIYIAAKTGV